MNDTCSIENFEHHGPELQQKDETRGASLFPMVFEPFEEFMLANDRPGARNTFAMELTFEGSIQREAFEAGLDQALSRHPLFCALLVRRRWFRPQWVDSAGIRPLVIWADSADEFSSSHAEGIDISCEVGLRFCIRNTGDSSKMFVVFHHCCCDAVGAVQFLADLFTGYAHNLDTDSASRPDFPCVSSEDLKHRGDLHIHPQQGRRFLWYLWQSLAYATRTFLLPAARLAIPLSHDTEAPPCAESSGCLTSTLDSEVNRALRMLARRQGVTVNDLLIRELFLGIRDWNATHAPGLSRQWLSLMVPTNLRTLEHDRMPAANIVSATFMKRHVKDCADPARLLTSISQEVAYIRATRFAAGFLTYLRWLRWVPGFRTACSKGGYFATTVFSNVGDAWRLCSNGFPSDARGHAILGNLVLKDVNTASPLPNGTRASFTLWRANERMRVGLRYDSNLFSPGQAQSLLSVYVSRITALANAATGDQRVRTAA